VKEITHFSITLLQTRVDYRVASQFKQAAKERGMSKYELLGELIAPIHLASLPNILRHVRRHTGFCVPTRLSP
jgi:hypothetical protein